MLDVIGFYKETREQSQDDVWEKFGNAHPRHASSELVKRMTPPPLPQRTKPRLVVVASSNMDETREKPSLPARPANYTPVSEVRCILIHVTVTMFTS